MPIYLWTAKNASGVESAQKISAPSAQHARSFLEAQGYSDLKLIKDDIMAEITAKSEEVTNLTAAEQVKTLTAGKTTLGNYFFKVARDSFTAILFGALLISWRLSRHDVIG